MSDFDVSRHTRCVGRVTSRCCNGVLFESFRTTCCVQLSEPVVALLLLLLLTGFKCS